MFFKQQFFILLSFLSSTLQFFFYLFFFFCRKKGISAKLVTSALRKFKFGLNHPTARFVPSAPLSQVAVPSHTVSHLDLEEVLQIKNVRSFARSSKGYLKVYCKQIKHDPYTKAHHEYLRWFVVITYLRVPQRNQIWTKRVHQNCKKYICFWEVTS